jgi:hypothetical protein
LVVAAGTEDEDVATAAGFWPTGGVPRKASRSKVPNSTLAMTDNGTPKLTTRPPATFRSSSWTVASGTCTSPLLEVIRPLKLRVFNLSGGRVETSMASHLSVSRSLGATRLNSPEAVGRAVSPDSVDLAWITMSPGRVASSFGTATAPPRASSSSETLRTACW